MSQKPESDSRIPAPPNAEQVADYLCAHPDFLARRPDLLSVLDPPSQPASGDNIADFQTALIRRLRREKEDATDVAQELIDTSRDNLTSTTRIHDAVMALLGADSFERLVETVQTDLPMILDMDAVVLCVESARAESFPIRTVTLVPPGFVDRQIGTGKSHLLRADVSGDPEIFAGAAPLIRSDALVRLEISSQSPPALLAFGHRDEDKFHPGQATELIAFLSRVLSQLIRIWLGHAA
ncbi:DUF484 family protein [Marivibrio halodurans]|uniref:DUF484 family protein n=1 Tax=Marivibrio halodurans TaxID=2039722 RepID=A0A8J7V5I9_9PROT|nr:DUF484 family protein [Marivibrio halodurans]MBP5858994.1 DUF484 family protein [Marivibrio halodurans]